MIKKVVHTPSVAIVNEVYARYFPNEPPARATIGVAALAKGAHVEIEVVASHD